MVIVFRTGSRNFRTFLRRYLGEEIRRRARFKSGPPQEKILRSCRLLITRSADSGGVLAAVCR